MLFVFAANARGGREEEGAGEAARRGGERAAHRPGPARPAVAQQERRVGAGAAGAEHRVAAGEPESLPGERPLTFHFG